MGKAGEGRDEGKYCGCGGRRAGGHRGPPLQTTYVTRRRGRPLCRPVVGVCTSVVPLIRHGFAMPPSPWKGEGFRRAILAFPTQGGRCPEGADEGQSGCGCPQTGCVGKAAPHQSPSVTASVSAPRAAFGGCAPTRACGRSPEGEAFPYKKPPCTFFRAGRFFFTSLCSARSGHCPARGRRSLRSGPAGRPRWCGCAPRR